MLLVVVLVGCCALSQALFFLVPAYGFSSCVESVLTIVSSFGEAVFFFFLVPFLSLFVFFSVHAGIN